MRAAPHRPPTFQVTASDASALDQFSTRQESLMPGEVRTPQVRPTPLLGDWARGDSTVWEDTSSNQQPVCTPLNSYGRDELWQISSGDDRASGAQAAPPRGEDPLSHDDDEDAAVNAVRHTVNQVLAASQDTFAHMGHTAGSYTAESRTYSVTGDDGAYAPYIVSSGGGNKFTVQHASDPHSTRGDHLLSREVSAQELGSRQGSTDSSALLAKFRSQSEILSDELYFQAKTFPPPPPSNSPMETRRVRAELWYLISRKWDITQQMPPPPRSPLPGMEEEHRLRLQELTRVPYRGDRWLAQSDHWFRSVQQHFNYPPENVANVLSPSFVLQMCA